MSVTKSYPSNVISASAHGDYTDTKHTIYICLKISYIVNCILFDNVNKNIETRIDRLNGNYKKRV